MPATTRRLLEPVLEELLRYTNFANGRLLTADDLKSDQNANRLKDQLLGRALGAGVVTGLEVSQAGSATVAITPGEAVTPSGQVVTLSSPDIQVAITATAAPTVFGGAGAFQTCDDKPDLVFLANAGLYLLTAAPASAPGGNAPANGPEEGRLGGCVNQYVAEGVQFRLLPVNATGLAVPGSADTLRNRAAYHLFGVNQSLPHLFDTSSGYGEAGPLRERASLGDDDVPLALFYFAERKIQFVDMWAARRRVVPSLTGQAASSLWERLAGPGRLAQAEAMLLQFQAQVAELATRGGALSVPARTWFDYLPPVGYLPPQVTSAQSFFGPVAVRTINPDPAYLRFLLLRSALVEPIPLNGSDAPPIGIYTSESPRFTLFVRLDREQPVVRDPRGNTGKMRVVADASKQDLGALQVRVIDTAGANRPVTTGDVAERAVFRAEFLEPGTYQVELWAYGRPVARQFREIARQGQEVEVRFSLPVTLTGGIPEEPAATADATWIDKQTYYKLVMLRQLTRSGGLPGDREWRELTGVPAGVMLPLIRMGSWLLRHHPGVAVDPAGIRLYVDSKHVPDGLDPHLYACAVFGSDGAAVPMLPLLLTPMALSSPLSVPVTKAKLAGFDRDLYDVVLEPNGLGDLDVIAAAWPGLISDLLEVTAETAQSIIREARAKADEYRSSLRIIKGIGLHLEQVLGSKGIGIASVLELARTNPTELVGRLAQYGVQITEAHARYIVDQARNVAPREQWAIDSSKVGLTVTEHSVLAGLGIATLTDLHQELTDPTAGAALIKKLGWNADAAKNVTDQIKIILK